jgi:uncharacterized protein (TIGR02145 family)
MKTIANSFKRTRWLTVLISFLICLLFLLVPSCQKSEPGQDSSLDLNKMSPKGLAKKDKVNYGKLKDIEGNEYKTVKIDKQWWMAENLKTTTYNDGTAIPTVTDLYTQWDNLNTPAYYVCNSEYGAIYNWYTINTGKLCPKGWHVSSDAEWTILIDFVGGAQAAADILRETGTLHWINATPVATNEVGFSALPGGWIFNSCTGEGSGGDWWTSTSHAGTPGSDYGGEVDIFIYKWWDATEWASNLQRGWTLASKGMSVRCLKD